MKFFKLELNVGSDSLQQGNKPMESVEIDYEALPETSPLVHQLAAGAFAGIMEHTVMFPVDSIKTRMQTSKIGAREGILQAFTRISAQEGPLALWRGVSSVVMGAGPAHAVYYLVFESTKTTLCNRMYNLDNNIVTTERFPLIAAVSGVAATITSDALMTPFDVVKQRMQNASDSSMKTTLRVCSHITKHEGLGAFFISYPTTLILSIPFAALNFGIYEFASDVLNPQQAYNPLVHCVAGGVSGAVAAALTTPLDVVKTALQTQSVKASGFFSAVKALRLKQQQQQGTSVFWRGLRPRVVFNVPATAISWTAYEMAKAYLMN